MVVRRVVTFATALLLSSVLFPVSYRQYTKYEQDVDTQITYIWNKCTREGVPDYDGNGIVNCCDKATMFCIKWHQQYGREVRLAQQQHARMNHMFVQVRMDWGWWSVDPSMTAGGTHDMKCVWGNRYIEGADDISAYWVRYFTNYIR